MKQSRKIKNGLMAACVWGAAGIVVLLVFGLLGYVLYKGLPGISWEFLTTSPSTLKGTIGIWPNILNTLYIVFLSLGIALPLGIGAAVYLNEYATSKRLVHAIEFTVEILAGIPSILYGLVGMLFFAQLLGFKTSLFAGGFTLVIMILPTVIRTTQEALRTVPPGYREGALALGATKWYVIRTIVLPASMNGILTGAILSIGRIVGESAALLYTAGVGSVVAGNLLTAFRQSGGTLSVMLYVYVQERAEFEVGYSIGAVLLLMVLTLNLLTKLANKRLGRMQKRR